MLDPATPGREEYHADGHVSISPLQAAGIRDAVDAGVYASGSEVVREALRLWEAARKRGELGSFAGAVGGSTSRGVADMFSDYEAQTRRAG